METKTDKSKETKINKLTCRIEVETSSTRYLTVLIDSIINEGNPKQFYKLDELYTDITRNVANIKAMSDKLYKLLDNGKK